MTSIVLNVASASWLRIYLERFVTFELIKHSRFIGAFKNTLRFISFWWWGKLMVMSVALFVRDFIRILWIPTAISSRMRFQSFLQLFARGPLHKITICLNALGGVWLSHSRTVPAHANICLPLWQGRQSHAGANRKPKTIRHISGKWRDLNLWKTDGSRAVVECRNRYGAPPKWAVMGVQHQIKGNIYAKQLQSWAECVVCV